MVVTEKERMLVERMAEPDGSAGMWAWFMQRLTAVVLLFFLGAHFWVLHYAMAGERIRVEAAMARLGSPFFIVVDVALLATAIYHALNGLRMVVFDFGFGRMVNRTFTLLLWIFGLAALFYGTNTLLYLITGSPIFYLRPS